jgi:hypothetical protein
MFVQADKPKTLAGDLTSIMKILLLFITATFFSLTVIGQSKTDEQKREIAFYTATKKWFSAWKLVSKDIYHIDKVKPVEFVFFDDKYVYSTSATTIKNGKPVKGCNLINLKLHWKKALHKDTITLPDKSVVPIGLMSFAAAIANEKNKSFFVMPLPGYWHQSGVESKALGVDNLITGVFIHEFSHSQQMQNFGKKIAEFEQQNTFGVEFSDDIVQDLFQKDTNYTKLYHEEVAKLYSSLTHHSPDPALVKEGLTLMSKRYDLFFKEGYSGLRKIDEFFLTMEGLGQYSMYLWLTHPKGGNITNDTAIEGVRRNKKRWSQDEGFALFLILDRLTKPDAWAREMFGYETESVTELIRKKLNGNTAATNNFMP